MSWNGSGTFNRIYSWVADAGAGLDISSSRMDTDTNDIASNGFGNCLTRDGQGVATANLPMATFRHTNVGNGVARTDYAALGQIQDGTPNWIAATGTADAITATYSPALVALVDAQLCFLRASAANATTTPTFAPNGLTAHTITKFGGAALSIGDIAGANAELILRYNLANTRWEFLNPGAGPQGILWAVSGGTANAVTATYSPAIASLSDGLIVGFRATAANTSTAPTFSPNGLTAHTITRSGGNPLIAGDIPGANAECLVRYRLSSTTWELLNPAISVPNWVAAAGTADAITATYAPAIPSLYDGLLCYFRASAANATTTPTFAPSALTAHTITRLGGSALVAGDIPAANAEVIVRYNLANTRWELLNPARKVIQTATTVQVFISGAAATYTTPAGCTQLKVRLVGGGGSGAGAGTTTSGNDGTVGNSTTFSSIVANGGAQGTKNSSTTPGGGGLGGNGGTGTATFRIPGGNGADGQWGVSTTDSQGGNGGSSAFGGAGASGSNPTNGRTNSGSGGAGGQGQTSNVAGAGGGGSGEYAEVYIPSPSATYSYTVGAATTGGSSGTGGQAGGGGAAGIIIVEEFYAPTLS